MDTLEENATQEDSYKEILERIAERYLSHFLAVPPKERTGSFVERQFSVVRPLR